MTGSIRLSRLIPTAALAGVVAFAFAQTAGALPTLNSSGLSPAQCYARDSGCTQMCGDVVGDLRYECFGICDRMLDRCLTTGEWSDSLTADPGTGKPPRDGVLLNGLLMRMMMLLSDSDGDGTLSPVEIEAVKERVYGKGLPVNPPKPVEPPRPATAP